LNGNSKTILALARLPLVTLYSLEKLIEWKPVFIELGKYTLVSLYSLEKLIEWKPSRLIVSIPVNSLTLYSLEKLIEWKQKKLLLLKNRKHFSLLAREIN